MTTYLVRYKAKGFGFSSETVEANSAEEAKSIVVDPLLEKFGSDFIADDDKHLIRVSTTENHFNSLKTAHSYYDEEIEG